MAVSERSLKKLADWSKLVGISIITLSVIVSLIDGLDLLIFNSSVGGITVGAILAFLVPFWLGRISKNKTFRKYL